MFKKLLNVGKGHSSEQQKLQQQQQQQQKQLFQLNEIRSYGFSHLCCLGYSASLSLLAVGSKQGLLRVLGNPSVEFSYQLEGGNSIRQIEFIDCRQDASNLTSSSSSNQSKKSSNNSVKDAAAKSSSTDQLQQASASARLVVLTDNGQLHLFELKTVKQQNFADNTTQTGDSGDCCKSSQQQVAADSSASATEFTKLELVGQLSYFKFKVEDEDKSKRVTTLEIAANGLSVYAGTEGGNLYIVPLDKFEPISNNSEQQVQSSASSLANNHHHHHHNHHNHQVAETGTKILLSPSDESDPTSGKKNGAASANTKDDEDETQAVNLNDEPTIDEEVRHDVDDVDDAKIREESPFEMIKFDEHVAPQLADEIKTKKQGAIESIKRHPVSQNGRVLLSYHRGLSVIYLVETKEVEKYFYHNQVLESSCFSGGQSLGEFFYTSHNDGSYIKWDTRQGSQLKANEDFLSQLYGPYPCKPTPKIQACTGLVNDQLEDLVVFSGGMPRATYDEKNPVTIVKANGEGKDSIKVVLDLTSKVLDFVVITRPRGQLGAGAKSTGGGGGGGGKKNKHKQQQKEQQRNNPIAVALAILAEEEFVVVDLLNSESYLEFTLPYLNCVHSSAITCNQHYSEISDELYDQLLAFNRQRLRGTASPNEWPLSGGKVIDAPELKSHDILLTGHEDGSVDVWDVSDLSMRHLLHLKTAQYFATNEDDLIEQQQKQQAAAAANGNQDQSDNNQDNSTANSNNQVDNESSAWPPMKRVGRFDPYSDDTRLAIRKVSLCPRTGTLVVAGTGGQVLVFELKDEPTVLKQLQADQITLVSDQRFVWKGSDKLIVRPQAFKQEPGYQLSSFVQLDPPVAATSLDLRSDWRLFALGTSYGFVLYDYASKHSVVTRCTLNVQDFAIVSGDIGATGAMSRKKSFRKSLRESFRRLRLGRSQRQAATSGAAASQADKPSPFGRATTGVRTLNAPSSGAVDGGRGGGSPIGAPRNVYSAERQVELKVELSSIVKCINLTEAIISNQGSFKPTLWVGTSSGQVLVYAIDLASEEQRQVAAALASSAAAPASPSAESQSSPTESSSQEVSAAADQETAEKQPEVVRTTAKLAKEIQLKHRAPIVAIFTSPEAPAPQQQAAANAAASDSAKSTPVKKAVDEAEESTDAKSPVDGNQDNEESAAAAARAPSPQSADKVKSSAVPQARVLICSEEQFKVFNLPNLKPFCKFKLTAHEGLRAKKISITQFLKPASAKPASLAQSSGSSQQLTASKSLQSFATQTSPSASPVPPGESAPGGSGEDQAPNANSGKAGESNNNSLSALNNNNINGTKTSTDSKELMNAKFGAIKSSTTNNIAAQAAATSVSTESQEPDFEPYMVCMSNQGDCAIYSVPDLKRQAQIQVCRREDVNGITSTMLTNYGEGFYLRSSSNFLRFSISSQRVLRVLSVV